MGLGFILYRKGNGADEMGLGESRAPTTVEMGTGTCGHVLRGD